MAPAPAWHIPSPCPCPRPRKTKSSPSRHTSKCELLTTFQPSDRPTIILNSHPRILFELRPSRLIHSALPEVSRVVIRMFLISSPMLLRGSLENADASCFDEIRSVHSFPCCSQYLSSTSRKYGWPPRPQRAVALVVDPPQSA